VLASDPAVYAAVKDSWSPRLCWKEIVGGNLQLLTR
jgi:hypothetical protein